MLTSHSELPAYPLTFHEDKFKVFKKQLMFDLEWSKFLKDHTIFYICDAVRVMPRIQIRVAWPTMQTFLFNRWVENYERMIKRGKAVG